jgi:Tfp pilus assembly protein PilV
MRHFLKTTKGFTPHSAGFTLLETVVAISILMVGVIGPITLAQRNVKASRDAGDRLVASFLAQEGIEAMRSVVANNSGDNIAWLTGVTTKCELLNGCGVDVSAFGQTSLFQCVGCTPVVYQNTATFVYRQSSAALASPWAATKFSRLTSITEVEPGKRATASTTVWWPRGNLTLQEDIYNWFFQLN